MTGEHGHVSLEPILPTERPVEPGTIGLGPTPVFLPDWPRQTGHGIDALPSPPEGRGGDAG